MDRVLQRALDVDAVSDDEERLRKEMMASLRHLLFNEPLPHDEIVRQEYRVLVEKVQRELAAANSETALLTR